MRITKRQLKNLIREQEEKSQSYTTTVPVWSGKPLGETVLTYEGMDTPYDQTIVTMTIQPHGEEPEEAELYASSQEDLADSILGYLEPETSENYEYWFLEEGDDDGWLHKEQALEFKNEVLGILKKMGVDPSGESDLRYSYRERDTGEMFQEGPSKKIHQLGRKMKVTKKQLRRIINEELRHVLSEKEEWSEKATKDAKWHPPKGLFTKSASKIANTLWRADPKKALSRLAFYVNRAGDNLDADEKATLEDARGRLEKKKAKEEKKD
tara:strand:+ start:522 stop:1322 length:801 start_codon:yes stop_codon:yes gene_type:complete